MSSTEPAQPIVMSRALIDLVAEQMESSRPLSRRKFLTRAAGLGISVPFASAALAACTSSPGPSSNGPSSSGTTGKTIVVASGSDALTLDPGTSFDGQSPLLWRTAYESLLTYQGGTATVVPNLADFEVSKDSLTYTFRIHPGIKFIDGEALNAAAVKLNIERQLGTKLGISYALTTLNKIETPDDMTVVLRLKDYYDGFISAFAGDYTVMMISPKAIIDHKGNDWAQSWLKSNMVGTGPYSLQSYTPSTAAKFIKNPTYWRGWQGSHVDNVLVTYTHSSQTEQLQLESGQVNIALFLPDDTVKSLLSAKGITVTNDRGFDEYYLMLNCNHGPTRNPAVRRAIAYGFDYQTYVNSLEGGLGAVQARGPIPSNLPGYNAAVPQYHYDPARAKQMLAAAGFPKGGFTIKMVYEPDFSWKANMATLFQANMMDLGINVTIQRLEPAAFTSLLSNPKTADAAYPWWWYPTLNTVGDYLFTQFATSAQGTAGSNNSYYSNLKFDQLLTKALAEPDEATRNSYYSQAQSIIVTDSPALFAMYRNQRIPMSSTVRGYTFNGIHEGTFDFYNMHLA